MFFLFALALSASDDEVYLGNWSLPDNSSDIDDAYAAFEIVFSPAFDLHFSKFPRLVYSGVADIRNSTSLQLFPITEVPLLGFRDATNTSYFFINSDSDDASSQILGLIGDIVLPIRDFSHSPATVNDRVIDIIRKSSPNRNFFTMIFVTRPEEREARPFRLPFGLNGTLFFDAFALNLIGHRFDMNGYIAAGKLFAVFTAISIVTSYYGWSSHDRRAAAFLSRLSIHSYIMHTGFEFSYSMLILNMGLSFAPFRRVFGLLFMACIGIYFGFQMVMITNIWKFSHDLGEVDAPGIRWLFVRFFGQISILMFGSLLAMVLMTSFPLVSLLYLYSAFVPQIVFTAQTGQKKTGDTAFVTIATVNRLCILWYFFVYPNNIAFSIAPRTAAFIGVYAVLQLVFLLCQNWIDPSFFLPSRYRTQGFNYAAGRVEIGTVCTICFMPVGEDEETMMTPCGHGFHRECLETWMQHQMTCPADRLPLPDPV
jgi:hypothetical protein